MALQAQAARQADRNAEPRMRLEDLNFSYRISGARTAWRPVRVFDDGRQVILEFDAAIDQATLPPLFLPDPVPFVDEILFGLGTLLLANWKRRKDPPSSLEAPDARR